MIIYFNEISLEICI